MATTKETDRLYAFVAFLHDTASADELRRVLQADVVSDSLVASGGVDAAIAWLQKQSKSPQRLLVDISGSNRPLDDLDRLADACDPSVAVFVVGERNDVGLYRNLLSRGVQDYLVKPLSADLVRRIIMHEHTSVRQGRYGKSVAVIGTRGGVGVTSVAVHLARALVEGGVRRRVVYLDLNVYDGPGPGTLGHAGGSALLDVLNNIDRLDHQYLERSLAEVAPDFFVLSAELDYTEEFTFDEQALGALLDALSQYFHYVVVDVPSRAGQMFQQTIQHAALVCLVADTSVLSARNLGRLSSFIGSRPNPPSVFAVLNHAWPAVQHKVRDSDFREVVNQAIRVNIPHDPKGPLLAENLAQPLAQGSEFARGVKTLANLVTGEAVASSKKSWWQRLVGAK